MSHFTQCSSGSDWYVLYTIPRNEKKVYSELTRREIKAFLPLQKVVRLWGTRKQKLVLPLFPNYLFVSIPRNLFWTVLAVSGVVRFVLYNGAPATIKSAEMEAMQKLLFTQGNMAGGDLSYQVEEADLTCRAGEQVQVKSGPFEGLKGKVLQLQGKTKFFIEFEQINRVISVDVCSTLLEKVAV